MGKLIFNNNQSVFSQAAAYYKGLTKNITLKKKTIEAIPELLTNITTEIDEVSSTLSALDKLLKTRRISSTELIRKLTTTNSKPVNDYFNNLIKTLIKYPKTKGIYQSNGLVKAMQYVLMEWAGILCDIHDDITRISNELAEDTEETGRLGGLKFESILYLNIYTSSLIVEYIGRSFWTLINVILSGEDISKYNNIGLILKEYREVQDITIALVNGNTNVSILIKKNVSNRGMNSFIFGKESLFKYAKFSDFVSGIINILRLSSVSRSLFSGTYFIDRKIKKAEELNKKKKYMELRMLYLKNELAESGLSTAEKERLKTSIESYEAFIQKTDKELNSIYM